MSYPEGGRNVRGNVQGPGDVRIVLLLGSLITLPPSLQLFEVSTSQYDA